MYQLVDDYRNTTSDRNTRRLQMLDSARTKGFTILSQVRSPGAPTQPSQTLVQNEPPQSQPVERSKRNKLTLKVRQMGGRRKKLPQGETSGSQHFHEGEGSTAGGGHEGSQFGSENPTGEYGGGEDENLGGGGHASQRQDEGGHESQTEGGGGREVQSEGQVPPKNPELAAENVRLHSQHMSQPLNFYHRQRREKAKKTPYTPPTK